MRRLSLLVLLVPLAAPAQDAPDGRLLYQTYCGGCHYERVHDRMRSAVHDVWELREMVARWESQTKRTFTLDEREAIVQYLNESHYRFGLPARKR